MRCKSPLFSVIVPIYNNGHDLKKCINSILTQTYTEFELILVDDGSTDESPQICDQFACRDERVRVIHKEKNGGVVAARNDGLFQAVGKYVYYVDGDDWIAKELLEKASEKFVKDESLDIFVFGYVKVYDSGRYVKRGIEVPEGIYEKERLRREVYPGMIFRMDKRIRGGIDTASLCNKIIRRELLNEHYCRNTVLFRGEDSVCSWECMYFAAKIYFLDEYMYFYNRFSDNSVLKRYREDLYDNNKAVTEYLQKHLGVEQDFRINQQINVLEVQGVLEAVYQEVDFHHSIFGAARLLREKHKEYKYIRPSEGMSLKVRLYILLLNLSCFKTLQLFMLFEYCINDVYRMFKKLIYKTA